MILKYYMNKEEKIYTLKGSIDGKETKDAHYKFIKFKDVQNDGN